MLEFSWKSLSLEKFLSLDHLEFNKNRWKKPWIIMWSFLVFQPNFGRYLFKMRHHLRISFGIFNLTLVRVDLFLQKGVLDCYIRQKRWCMTIIKRWSLFKTGEWFMFRNTTEKWRYFWMTKGRAWANFSIIYYYLC